MELEFTEERFNNHVHSTTENYRFILRERAKRFTGFNCKDKKFQSCSRSTIRLARVINQTCESSCVYRVQRGLSSELEASRDVVAQTRSNRIVPVKPRDNVERSSDYRRCFRLAFNARFAIFQSHRSVYISIKRLFPLQKKKKKKRKKKEKLLSLKTFLKGKSADTRDAR